MKPMNARRHGRAPAQVVGILAIVNVFVALCGGAEAAKPLRIVAFGDSLFAGYGLKTSQAFPAQLQKALKARGHDVVVANASVSGDTTAAGLQRLEWSLPEGTDAVILELGANDALRAIDPKETRANLEKIIAKLKERRIPILLVGMLSPANWGEGYADAFDAIFPELAREHGLIFYPFVLDGVLFNFKLNLSDGMHPSGKGVAEMVKRLLPSVEQLVEQAASREVHPKS